MPERVPIGDMNLEFNANVTSPRSCSVPIKPTYIVTILGYNDLERKG